MAGFPKVALVIAHPGHELRVYGWLEALIEEPPYYESYGERQVAAGRYPRVLRFREHFLPLARVLRELGRTG